MINADLEDKTTDRKSNESRMTRRSLLFSGTAVLGGLALWGRFGSHTAQADTQIAKPGIVTIVNFSDDGKRLDTVKVPRIIKTDAEWRQQLSTNSFDITRKADTEMAYTGSTWNEHSKGLFRCICCDTALFSSSTKFDSGTGWPSFWEPIAKQNVSTDNDNSLGMDRTEVHCTRCVAHLGHVFDDGPRPTGLRYCMNSASMRFVKQA